MRQQTAQINKSLHGRSETLSQHLRDNINEHMRGRKNYYLAVNHACATVKLQRCPHAQSDRARDSKSFVKHHTLISTTLKIVAVSYVHGNVPSIFAHVFNPAEQKI